MGNHSSPRNIIVFGSFSLLLVTAWTVLVQWAWATWANRRNPYARARQPAWLVAEMTFSTYTTTIICLDEMLRCHGLRLPCRLVKVAAVQTVFGAPALVLWRSLQLW